MIMNHKILILSLATAAGIAVCSCGQHDSEVSSPDGKITFECGNKDGGLFYSVSDIERIGDHAENMAEQAEYLAEHGLDFTETGMQDLKNISSSVVKSFQYAIDARQNGSMDAVRKVSQYEDDVDSQEEELREKHIERLSSGQCQPSAGVVFLDIISNLERISDHAYNLAGYVKDEM